jgi:hypothetical protein
MGKVKPFSPLAGENKSVSLNSFLLFPLHSAEEGKGEECCSKFPLQKNQKTFDNEV